ncbi:mediator complex subunit med7 [Cystoisospora suis]|uniref:Mediator of RNA polymerase II transcription subunit 7 n=1 Tax=Cystoisospora suis TaxID=483139 RepID=A0A2C6LH44_9APIC|nr:mediator complex subunit med7 [Cystoisospora suis]
MAVPPSNNPRYVTGFPPPPFFYLEYAPPSPQGKAASNDTSGVAAVSNSDKEAAVRDSQVTGDDKDGRRALAGEGLRSAWKWGGRPPPVPVKDFWSAFGATYSEAYVETTLDSDTKLYYETEEERQGSTGCDIKECARDIDLKEEFKRLYALYVQESLGLLDSLARGGGGGGETQKWRKLVKVHKNLLHILVKLRTFQAEDEVIARLTRQLEKRREAADELRRALSAALDLTTYHEATGG